MGKKPKIAIFVALLVVWSASTRQALPNPGFALRRTVSVPFKDWALIQFRSVLGGGVRPDRLFDRIPALTEGILGDYRTDQMRVLATMLYHQTFTPFVRQNEIGIFHVRPTVFQRLRSKIFGPQKVDTEKLIADTMGLLRWLKAEDLSGIKDSLNLAMILVEGEYYSLLRQVAMIVASSEKEVLNRQQLISIRSVLEKQAESDPIPLVKLRIALGLVPFQSPGETSALIFETELSPIVQDYFRREWGSDQIFISNPAQEKPKRGHEVSLEISPEALVEYLQDEAVLPKVKFQAIIDSVARIEKMFVSGGAAPITKSAVPGEPGSYFYHLASGVDEYSLSESDRETTRKAHLAIQVILEFDRQSGIAGYEQAPERLYFQTIQKAELLNDLLQYLYP